MTARMLLRRAGSIRLGRVAPVTAARSFSSTRVGLDSSKYPPHILFPMPALSPTMETGVIAQWNLSEGGEFGAGDTLCEIETDKATMDFEAQDEGILAKILMPPGQEIAVGVPICVIVEEASDVAAFANFTIQEETPVPAAAAAAAAPSAPPVPVPAAPTSVHPLLPSARHLSESKGLDATSLIGTGKGGRVTKGDVLLALENGTPMPALAKASPASTTAAAAPVAVAVAAPVAPTATPMSAVIPEIDYLAGDTFEDVPNNNMRKIIAKRLTESKGSVPHFYTAMEIELDELMALRKTLKDDFGVKVSVNDLIIRSSALALRDVPEVNATYDPKTSKVSIQPTIDISVAVATPTGLITPIVPKTDELGLTQITDTVRDLATRARLGKLKPAEYQGGTFCISNLGMFGIDEFSAVINPPQAAILAVGGGTRRIVPSPWVDGAEKQLPPVIRTIMTARLSADRRVVDEATAALFLSAFHKYLSQPSLLLL